MEDNKITFEALPQATSNLQAEVHELKETLETFMKKVLEIKPENPNELVGIDEACRILGLKKPTLYHKAQRKEIKSYKPAGCKMIMFKRSDLMEWIEHGGKTSSASLAAIEAQLQGCIRHKPKSSMGGK